MQSKRAREQVQFEQRAHLIERAQIANDLLAVAQLNQNLLVDIVHQRCAQRIVDECLVGRPAAWLDGHARNEEGHENQNSSMGVSAMNRVFQPLLFRGKCTAVNAHFIEQIRDAMKRHVREQTDSRLLCV